MDNIHRYSIVIVVTVITNIIPERFKLKIDILITYSKNDVADFPVVKFEYHTNKCHLKKQFIINTRNAPMYILYRLVQRTQ